MKKPLDKQLSIGDLFHCVQHNIETTRAKWTETKPGIKVVWLNVAKADLERLIAIAEREELRND